MLNPLSSIGYWQMPAELTGITTPLSWGTYPFLLGMGPLWFVALLLVFDFGYAGWRRLTGHRISASKVESPFPGYPGVGVFIVSLALVSYLVRLVIPMGKDVLGFPTLAYLPQYLGLFALGVVASRCDWLRGLPASTGIAGFAVATVATVLLFPLALSGRLFSLQIAEPAGFVGHGTWQSAVYALWDSTVAVGMCLGVLTLFRQILGSESGLGRFLSRHSYAVYVIHAPIVVFLAIALRGVQASALPKFVLGSLLIVPACFLVAYIIRKIPGVSRIM